MSKEYVEVKSIFDVFDEYYPGDMHCVPLRPCKLCSGRAYIAEGALGGYFGFCGRCGMILGMPFGYGSRLNLADDWNWGANPEPEQLDLFGDNPTWEDEFADACERVTDRDRQAYLFPEFADFWK